MYVYSVYSETFLQRHLQATCHASFQIFVGHHIALKLVEGGDLSASLGEWLMVGEEVLSAKTILKPLSCDIISWPLDKEDWDLYMYTQFQNNVQTHTLPCLNPRHGNGRAVRISF